DFSQFRSRVLGPQFAEVLRQPLAPPVLKPQDQLPEQALIRAKTERAVEMGNDIPALMAAVVHAHVRADRAQATWTRLVRISSQDRSTSRAEMPLIGLQRFPAG